MIREFKTHFSPRSDKGFTYCGSPAMERVTADDWEQVTCKRCLNYRYVPARNIPGQTPFKVVGTVTGRFSGKDIPNAMREGPLMPKTPENREIGKAAELAMGYGGNECIPKGDTARYQEKTARLVAQGEMGAAVFQERILRASELEKKLAEEIAEKFNAAAANKMFRAEDDIEPMGKLAEEPLSELLATIEVFRSYCRAVEALIGSGTVFDKNTVNLCRIILSLSSDIFKAVDNLKPPPD